MVKRDLYCFKSGKLELSILDEGLEEETKEKLAYSDLESQMSYITLDQEGADTSNPKDDQEMNFTSYSQPQLIITEEIFHTLKTMSEFLMRPEAIVEEIVNTVAEDIIEETVEEIVDTVAEDIIEEIVEAIVEELVDTVAEDISEAIIEAIVEEIVEDMVEALVEDKVEIVVEDSIENIAVDDRAAASEANGVIKYFDRNNTNQAMLEAKVHQEEIAEAYLSSSEEKAVNMENMQHHINSNTAMQQRLIDDILLSHFGEITTKFPYERELKQKIENQIYKIKSYK